MKLSKVDTGGDTTHHMVLDDVSNAQRNVAAPATEKSAVSFGVTPSVREQLQHGVLVCCAGNTKQRRLSVAAGERISWRIQEVQHHSLRFHVCFVANSPNPTAARAVLDVVEQ